jgi:hypothetical protein
MNKGGESGNTKGKLLPLGGGASESSNITGKDNKASNVF